MNRVRKPSAKRLVGYGTPANDKELYATAIALANQSVTIRYAGGKPENVTLLEARFIKIATGPKRGRTALKDFIEQVENAFLRKEMQGRGRKP